MKFKKLVSVLCSATCGIGGVGARQNGGMKEKFREILKARVVGNVIDEEVVDDVMQTLESLDKDPEARKEVVDDVMQILESLDKDPEARKEVVDDVMQILESLDKDPEARKKVLELASSYEVKSWVRYLFSVFGVAGSGVAWLLSVSYVLLALSYMDTAVPWPFLIAAVIFLAAGLGLNLGASAFNRSSAKYHGIKEALEELVKEAEGIRNQAGVSGNKLQKGKNNVSESKKDSQKSDKDSRKGEKRGRSEKVKAEKAGNSARSDNLVLS